jgi:L-alanine-DL-glutamate epimerase-like enolase superfamily enzyme
MNENDIAAVRAVRDAISNDVILIVDANSGWSVRQALWALKKIEGLDILLEQPTRYVEGLREVRKRTSVPIIADESCQGLQDTVRPLIPLLFGTFGSSYLRWPPRIR